LTSLQQVIPELQTILLDEVRSTGVRVVTMDPQTDPRWEDFVLTHPEGSIYHHPDWLQVLQKEYRQKPMHLACEDSAGRLLAVLPMLYTRGIPLGSRSPLAGLRLASLPRTPVAGVLSKDPQATAAILRAAVECIQQKPGPRLQLKTQGTNLDGLMEGLTATPWRLSYVLHLPAQGPFRVADSHDRASIKWAVNKATRLGVSVRPAESDADLRAWYALYLDTMRRNVVLPRPFRFFVALSELLRPHGRMQLLLAERREGEHTTIIGGSVFLMFGRTVSYVFNGSSVEGLQFRPNDVIQWHAINEACKNGFEIFDFGEVPDGNSDLAKFKSKWGAEPTRLYRYYYPAPPTRESSTGESKSRPRQLAENLWRRLPLGATEWVGDRTYSCL
jgi:CelD/BcsL family acetyltransferase involved in cellulose biosynthesis